MQILKISRRRLRSFDYAEPGHFTLLFCRGLERNGQRFMTNVHSSCFPHEIFLFFFCDFLLAVVVVVCLSSRIQAKEDDDITVPKF